MINSFLLNSLCFLALHFILFIALYILHPYPPSVLKLIEKDKPSKEIKFQFQRYLSKLISLQNGIISNTVLIPMYLSNNFFYEENSILVTFYSFSCAYFLFDYIIGIWIGLMTWDFIIHHFASIHIIIYSILFNYRPYDVGVSILLGELSNPFFNVSFIIDKNLVMKDFSKLLKLAFVVIFITCRLLNLQYVRIIQNDNENLWLIISTTVLWCLSMHWAWKAVQGLFSNISSMLKGNKSLQIVNDFC